MANYSSPFLLGNMQHYHVENLKHIDKENKKLDDKIKNKVDKEEGKGLFSGSYNDLTNKPESLPASDVSAWAKESTKPSYTASEVGALADTVTHLSGDVPTTRKVNNKELNADISLSASDVGADVSGSASAVQDNLDTHTGDTSNPHSVTKSQVGLGDVENKSSATIRGEITSSNVTTALGYTPLNSTLKGANSGLAELDASGKVPSSQLPSYVDDVLEYTDKSSFPETGETGKIYLDIATNLAYRWSGTTYVEISPSLALGETSSTAYAGDKGKIAYDHSQATHARTDATKVESSETNGNVVIDGAETVVYTHPTGTNPHGTTKSDVGLGDVGNFKAVSTVASQGLTDTEKSNARANIGAGTSSFSGSYNDLSDKPTIPTNNNQLTNGAGYITSSGSCNYATSAGNASTVGGVAASSFAQKANFSLSGTTLTITM